MLASAPIERPPTTVAAEGARAYIGYRWAGAAAAALAGVVLADRLGHRGPPQLADAFGRERVERRAHGEFVWPVTVVDEWLASRARTDARPRRRRSHRALERALGVARAALPRTLSASHPNTASARGGR